MLAPWAARGSGPAFGAFDPAIRLRVDRGASIGDEKRRLPAPKSIDCRSSANGATPRTVPMTPGLLPARPKTPWPTDRAARRPRRVLAGERVSASRRTGSRANSDLEKCKRPRYHDDCTAFCGRARDGNPEHLHDEKALTMRNTCVVFIPRVTAQVQLPVITNLQPVCVVASARLPGIPSDNDTTPPSSIHTGTARTTPLTSPLSGYQATPPYDPQAQASTYALKCFVPPRGPFSGGE
jgi:hypothetical protein